MLEQSHASRGAMEAWPEAVDSAGVTRVMRLLACARRADCADMALQALLASDLRVSLRRKETVSAKEAVSSVPTQVPGHSNAVPADQPRMCERRSESGDGRQAVGAARGGRGGVRVVHEDEVLLWVKCRWSKCFISSRTCKIAFDNRLQFSGLSRLQGPTR